MLTEQRREQLKQIPRSNLPEGHNDFAGLHEIAGERYLRKSLVGNLEGFYLAAEARAQLGVSSLQSDLGIRAEQVARAYVHIDGDTVTISQPYGRELYAYCSIGLDSKVAEESERKCIEDVHKVADFFKRNFPNKRVVEKEPQWIPTRQLEKDLGL